MTPPNQPNQRHDRLFYWALGFLTLLLLLMVTVNIQLSMMRVAFTTQIYGSDQLLAGKSGALRFTALADDGFSFENDLSAEVRLVYEEDGQDFLLFSGANQLGDTLEVNFTVPERLGAAMIIVTMNTPSGTEFIKLPVKVVKHSQSRELRRLAVEQILPENKETHQRCCFPELAGGETLYAYPESGLLAPAAENTIYLFSKPRAEKRPLRLAVPMTILHPDSWGVSKITINPGIVPVFDLEIEGEEGDGATDDLKLPLQVAPAQMMVKVSKNWARPGEKISADILTLRRQEIIYLDLWYKGSLLASQAVPVKNGRGNFEFTLPPDLSGLYWLQIYRPFVNPGETQDGRAIYVSAGHEEADLWQLLNLINNLPGPADPLLRFLAESKPEIPWHKGDMLAEIILSRLERREAGAPLLLDSGPQKRAAFAATQEAGRQKLYYGYLISGLLIVILLVTVVITHYRVTKKSVDSVLAEADELQTDDKPPQIALIPDKLALVLLICGFLLSLWAIAILLENLKWTVM